MSVITGVLSGSGWWAGRRVERGGDAGAQAGDEAGIGTGRLVVDAELLERIGRHGRTSRLVDVTERPPGAHEQRFGGVHGAAEHLGDLGHRQAVEVAQRERGAVVGAEAVERVVCREHVEVGVPRVLVAAPAAGSSATACRRRCSRSTRRQWSTSLWRAMPISQAVVTVGPGALPDGVDGADEDLRCDVLGDGAVAQRVSR